MDLQQEYIECTQRINEYKVAKKQQEAQYNSKEYNIGVEYSKGEPEQEAQHIRQDVTNKASIYQQLIWEQKRGIANQTEYTIEGLEKAYPAFTQLKPIILKWYEYTVLEQEETTYMYNLKSTDNQPDKDASQQMNNIQTGNDKATQQTVATASSDGHVYPVAMVQSWTKELESANKQLKSFLEKFQQLNLDRVDRMWLRKQIQRFSKWIKEKLSSIRLKIVLSLKGMMKPIKEALALIEPILKPPSLDTIITWANNIIKVWMKPYEKIVTFIKDCTTYTPPLVAQASSLVSTASSAPAIITNKTAELTGEGASIIQEEIANAVGDISFEPISIGDVM